MDLKNVTLELSSKPFYDGTPEMMERVSRTMFSQWKNLTDTAEQMSVLLWIADGSEILEYTGDLFQTFEWACWCGCANPIPPTGNETERQKIDTHRFPKNNRDDVTPGLRNSLLRSSASGMRCWLSRFALVRPSIMGRSLLCRISNTKSTRKSLRLTRSTKEALLPVIQYWSMRSLSLFFLDRNLWFFAKVSLKPKTLLLLSMLTGWMSRQQQQVIDYLVEENRILREQLNIHAKGKRIRFNANQRRRLAEKGRCQLRQEFVV